MPKILVHSVHSHIATAEHTLYELREHTQACGLREALYNSGYIVWVDAQVFLDIYGEPKYDLTHLMV